MVTHYRFKILCSWRTVLNPQNAFLFDVYSVIQSYSGLRRGGGQADVRNGQSRCRKNLGVIMRRQIKKSFLCKLLEKKVR